MSTVVILMLGFRVYEIDSLVNIVAMAVRFKMEIISFKEKKKVNFRFMLEREGTGRIGWIGVKAKIIFFRKSLKLVVKV